jgi:hypothetical protein
MIAVVAFSAMTDDSAGLPAGTLQAESQVMRMLAAGHTNKEIGGELGISVRTVEMHHERVLQKLKLSTRADIVSACPGMLRIKAKGTRNVRLPDLIRASGSGLACRSPSAASPTWRRPPR